MSERIREYTATTFAQALNSTQAPFLVHFGTDWCSPCKRQERVLLELLQDGAGAVVIGKVNVEDDPDLARAYSVTRNPTVCLFREGELISRQEGFTDKSVLQELLGQLP